MVAGFNGSGPWTWRSKALFPLLPSYATQRGNFSTQHPPDCKKNPARGHLWRKAGLVEVRADFLGDHYSWLKTLLAALIVALYASSSLSPLASKTIAPP
jgi:hypothetical protein